MPLLLYNIARETDETNNYCLVVTASSYIFSKLRYPYFRIQTMKKYQVFGTQRRIPRNDERQKKKSKLFKFISDTRYDQRRV